MAVGPEIRINLGRAARGVYHQGLPLQEACPEIEEQELDGANVTKIDRNTKIAKASHDMMIRMEQMRNEFPPFGLVTDDIRGYVRIGVGRTDRFRNVTEIDGLQDIKNPDDIVPQDLDLIINNVGSLLKSTMRYALIKEKESGNDAINNLPNLRDLRLDDPIYDIMRGAATAVKESETVLKAVVSRYKNVMHRSTTYKEFRNIALNSTSVLYRLASMNIDNFIDIESESDESIFRFNPEKNKLELNEEYNNRGEIPWLNLVTTGCPALVHMDSREQSPVQYVYNRFIDLVT
jgi:hypothetical protein